MAVGFALVFAASQIRDARALHRRSLLPDFGNPRGSADGNFLASTLNRSLVSKGSGSPAEILISAPY